jgi:hypothetical protein
MLKIGGFVEQNLKRISLLIRQDQYERLSQHNLNLSALVRDLIDDHLGEHNIVIAASEELKKIYDTVITDTGSNDSEIEKYFKKALGQLLKEKISRMQQLQKEMDLS